MIEFEEQILKNKSRTDIINFLRNEKIIIYGGGRIGKNIEAIMKQNNISIYEIWDVNAKELGGNVKVPNYNLKYKNVIIIIAIYSQKSAEEIKNKFNENGIFSVVFHDSKIISGISCDEFFKNENFVVKKCNKCTIEVNGCDKYLEFKKNECKAKNEFILKKMFLQLTTRCTLKCKYCLQYAPYIKKEKHCDIKYEEFIDIWRSFISEISYIHVIELSGGEVFLNIDLFKILNELINEKKIGIVNILTNGTINIEDKHMELLKNSKIVVTVDLYGEKLSENMQLRNKYFIEKLERFNINYTMLDNSNGTWCDFGDFKDRNRTDKELISIFNNCPSNNCIGITADYNFVICGRQRFRINLGAVESNDNDSINLRVIQKGKLETKIKTLLSKKHLDICRYCNGMNNNNLVKAGVQILK